MFYLAGLVITQNSLYSRIENTYDNFIDKYHDVLNIDSHLKLLNKN